MTQFHLMNWQCMSIRLTSKCWLTFVLKLFSQQWQVIESSILCVCGHKDLHVIWSVWPSLHSNVTLVYTFAFKSVLGTNKWSTSLIFLGSQYQSLIWRVNVTYFARLSYVETWLVCDFLFDVVSPNTFSSNAATTCSLSMALNAQVCMVSTNNSNLWGSPAFLKEHNMRIAITFYGQFNLKN